MKVQVFLPVTIIASAALFGLMKIRKKEQEKEDRRFRFQDIKLRVTYDVLGEYQNEKTETQNLLDKTHDMQRALEEEVNMLQTKAEKAKGDVDVCQGGQKSATDALASVETEFNNLKAETDKAKASWNTEVETLKQQLAARSAVCDFVKQESQAANNLCGPKKEEPKPEAPKQEAPKAEAPKQEAPKAEAPKQEEAKAEAPKQEAPKEEAPKQEAPKEEAPKQEAPKEEAPKQEEAKAEAPKKR